MKAKNITNQKLESVETLLEEATVYSALCTGLVISLVRASEPYFFFVIKKEVWSWFGELLTQTEIDNSHGTESESLSTVLASSLNVELVNVILESISTRCSGEVDEKTTYKTFNE